MCCKNPQGKKHCYTIRLSYSDHNQVIVFKNYVIARQKEED